MKDIDMSCNVHSDLVSYVYENLPRTLETPLEKAIGVYTLMCNVLKYDPDYVVYGDFDRTDDFQNVTRENNNVVCYTVSTILYKLMNLCGVKAILHGDLDGHMYVSLETEGMILMFDATRSGYFSFGYNMSDLTNVKYGLMPDGISAMPYGAEISKIQEVKKRLKNCIKNVYKKIGLNTDGSYKFNKALDKIYSAEQERDVIYDEEGIVRNVAYVDSFKFLEDSDVENAQLLNKILSTIFKDIWDERVENITLFSEVSGKVRLNKLVVIYDEYMSPIYYLFQNGKLVRYDVDRLYEVLVEEGWYFRFPTDIDALGDLEMEKVNRLYIY